MKPLVLIILDGWGLAPNGPGNAIFLAQTPHMTSLWNSYPHTQLAASGEAVGLPSHEYGNTETGHINIAAGRVVYQDLPRINMSITDGTFFKNDAFIGAIRYTEQHNSNLHIMGLLSDSGVHASREHLYALLQLIKRNGYQRPVYIHLFTDGRDSPPNSSLAFLAEVEDMMKRIGTGTIATVIGRYFAMDRDRRWERTEAAYNALTSSNADAAPSAREAIQHALAEGKTDEFIEPTIIVDSKGNLEPRITDNDAVIFFNYRIDRPRQLTRAFVLPNFESLSQPLSFDPYAIKYFHKHVIEEEVHAKPFKRSVIPKNLFFVTMTEYERNLPCSVAFPSERVSIPIGRVFSDMGLRQLRLSETEKERFIGYYFNGMREDPYPGEDRIIIPSPKVATYDLQPEMSAYELTEKLLERLALDVYSFIVINFANPDMVGHTGNIPAAIRACEVTDDCVGKIANAVIARLGACVVTGDHGNVEEMLGDSGEIDTEHSQYPVPFIMIDNIFIGYPASLPTGRLSDITPTILSHLNIPVPANMTGKNLLADIARQRR